MPNPLDKALAKALATDPLLEAERAIELLTGKESRYDGDSVESAAARDLGLWMIHDNAGE